MQPFAHQHRASDGAIVFLLVFVIGSDRCEEELGRSEVIALTASTQL